VCSNDQRPAINAALVAGEPKRAIAARFALSESAVKRHAVEHLPATLVRASEAAAIADAEALLAQVTSLQRRARAYEAQAASEGDLRTALAAIREQRELARLLVEVQGPPPECRPQATILWSFDPMTAYPDLPDAEPPACAR